MVKKRILKLSPISDPHSNLKAGTPTAPVSDTKTFSSSHYKTIILHDWWLVKPQCKGLAIGGLSSLERLGEKVVISTPIVKRHEANYLETQDGITFIVAGFINKPRTLENGFSTEICRHFRFGFPHNWEDYMSHGVGKEPNDGNTELNDSSSCPPTSEGDALTNDNFLATEIQNLFTGKGDLNHWLLRNSFNDAVGNITKNTKESQDKEDANANLETSALQDDLKCNVESGVPDDILETCENPSFGFESGMNVNSPKPCEGLSGKSKHKSPESSKEKEKCFSSSVLFEHLQGFRRVTRSMSKMRSTTKPIVPPIKEKKTRFFVESSPVRRSPRLCKLKNQVDKKTKLVNC